MSTQQKYEQGKNNQNLTHVANVSVPNIFSFACLVLIQFQSTVSYLITISIYTGVITDFALAQKTKGAGTTIITGSRIILDQTFA